MQCHLLLIRSNWMACSAIKLRVCFISNFFHGNRYFPPIFHFWRCLTANKFHGWAHNHQFLKKLEFWFLTSLHKLNSTENIAHILIRVDFYVHTIYFSIFCTPKDGKYIIPGWNKTNQTSSNAFSMKSNCYQFISLEFTSFAYFNIGQFYDRGKTWYGKVEFHIQLLGLVH